MCYTSSGKRLPVADAYSFCQGRRMAQATESHAPGKRLLNRENLTGERDFRLTEVSLNPFT
jgi:hypothetical protein